MTGRATTCRRWWSHAWRYAASDADGARDPRPDEAVPARSCAGARERHPRACRGRLRRPGRAERRGQVHPDPHLPGLRAPDRREVRTSWASTCGGTRRGRWRNSATSARRPGSTRCSRRATRSRWPPSCDRGSTGRRAAAAGGRRDPGRSARGPALGGQQAQLALTLALGTLAPVLLLDEPLASLDPLARREFLGTVAAAVAGGTTVLLSVPYRGRPGRGVRSADRTGAGARSSSTPRCHGRARTTGWCRSRTASGLDVVGSFANRRGVHTALVRTEEQVADPPRLDDIVLGYLAAGRRPEAAA